MGSSPDDVTDFCNLFNPFSHIMATVFTQRLTEISTRNVLRVNRARHGRLTNSPLSVSRLCRQYRIFDTLQPYRPPRSVTGIASFFFFFTFLLFKIKEYNQYFRDRILETYVLQTGIGFVTLRSCFP
jgi:hypothetical protein